MAGDNLGVGFRYEDIRDLCQKAIIGDPGHRAEDSNKNIALKTAVTGSGARNELRKNQEEILLSFHCSLMMVSG